MTTKMKIAGLMTALMVLSVPMVYADNGWGQKDSWHRDGDWHHGQQDHMMVKILGLTDDQVKQLKDLRKNQKEAMKNIFEQIKSNREAFETEMAKASPDMNKINGLQNQLKTIQGQMVDNHLNSILEIKKIMTPEQYAGYVALKKERRMMMHMMRHDQFGRKDVSCKDGMHKHWDDRKDGGDQD